MNSDSDEEILVKGYFNSNPSNHTKCSVCNLNKLTNFIGWELCSGRNMLFCPNHRVRYPCHNEWCEADLCFNFHAEKNWRHFISYIWDYINEDYD